MLWQVDVACQCGFYWSDLVDGKGLDESWHLMDAHAGGHEQQGAPRAITWTSRPLEKLT